MYRNAKAEMVRAGLTLAGVAEKMGIAIGTLSQKLNGKYPITVIEAKQFKKIVNSELPLEVLFKNFEEAGE